jgi:hypothetical protein
MIKNIKAIYTNMTVIARRKTMIKMMLHLSVYEIGSIEISNMHDMEVFSGILE